MASFLLRLLPGPNQVPSHFLPTTSHKAKNDRLIFLGRSGQWFHEALSMNGYRKFSTQISFSGEPYKNKRRIPTSSQINACRSYLEHFHLHPHNLLETRGQIFIIDSVDYSDNVFGFLRIIEDWAQEQNIDFSTIKNKITILNLGELGQLKSSSKNLKDLPSITNLRIAAPTLFQMATASDINSLISNYPYWDWNTSRPLNFTPTSFAMRLRQQLFRSIHIPDPVGN